MTDSNDALTLDMMFEWLEKLPVPEGYKSEIVGGHIFLWPQRDTHWDITMCIIEQLRAAYPREVVSAETAGNDYGPKKDAYATVGVPGYLIVDPYDGTWHLHTLPRDGKYHAAVSFGFGDDVDLTGTVVGLTLKTDGFPRD